jgi:hypothetical protein
VAHQSFRPGDSQPVGRRDHEEPTPEVIGYEKRDEIPFDFEGGRVSIVADTPASGGGRMLITKGAPEGIASLAVSYEAGGQVRAMTDNARSGVHKVYDASSPQGQPDRRHAGPPDRQRDEIPPKRGTSSNFENMFGMAGASLFLTFLSLLPTQILLNNFL